MKILLWLTIHMCLIDRAFPQSPSLTGAELQRYFSLRSERVKYRGKKAEFQGQERVSIDPLVNPTTQDLRARFMKRYPRRFEYLLVNRTEFVDLAIYYPDSLTMGKYYAQRLARNRPFMDYLASLLSPLTIHTPRQMYSQLELMKVASRFFLCDYVTADTTIQGHICIALNGTKEAHWSTDYTLLEAFCFEAIFDHIDRSDEPELMSRFGYYKQQHTHQRKGDLQSNKQLLEQVKGDVFISMAHDNTLRTVLMNYYKQQAHSLPFIIR